MSDNKAVGFQDCGSLYICGFCVCGFNQPQVKNIFLKKCYVVADVVYVVRPMMIVSILNIYRFPFCHYSLNSIVRQLFVALTSYKEAT